MSQDLFLYFAIGCTIPFLLTSVFLPCFYVHLFPFRLQLAVKDKLLQRQNNVLKEHGLEANVSVYNCNLYSYCLLLRLIVIYMTLSPRVANGTVE